MRTRHPRPSRESTRLLARRRTHALLSRITERLGTGDVTASPATAVTLILLGGFVTSLPFWALH
jgi:hypothetical protein